MKFTSTIILAASAALTSAQVTSNGDGTFTCAIPDAAYCAAGSLGSNIIIRCSGTVGYPGNCNDNLAGDFPEGVNYAPCWQSSATSGDAACSKNCVVYKGSGSGKQNGTAVLPDCTPIATQTSSVVAPISTLTFYPITNSSTTVYTQPSSFVTLTPSATTIYTTPTSVGPIATGTGSVGTGVPGSSGNSTLPAGTGAMGNPKSPSAVPSALFTGAASANQAGLVLASFGLLVAHFL